MESSIKPSPEKRLKEYALSYADRDWHIHPLRHIENGLCSCGNRNCPKPGKHPLFKGWERLATTDKAQIEKWWNKHPNANIGIATGKKSGLVVFDIDRDKGGNESLAKINQEYGDDWTKTHRVKTGSEGDHYYFNHPGDRRIGNQQNLGGYKGIDLRGDGGYVVAPPSNHISGGTYADFSPPDTRITSTPTWILNLVGRNGNGARGPAKNPQKEDYPLADLEKIRPGCPWVQHCYNDREELPEDQWYAVFSIIGRCENGDTLAHEWSKDYPGYSYAETARKLKQAREKSGPRTCQNIQEITGGTYCQACPYKDREKFSPIILGRPDRGLDPVHELNEKHAVVWLSGKCVILTETIDPHFNRPTVEFSPPKDIVNYYRNRLVEAGTTASGKPRYEKLGNYWLDHPDRRQYPGVVFAPDQPPGHSESGHYNLFKGFGVQSAQGDWSLFRQHIFEVIADGNREIFDYVLAWMAHPVQFPGGKRPGTSLVLRGSQGVGKGCFVSQYGQIFGQHFLHLSSSRQVTGRFNDHLKDAILVFADEAIFGGDRAAAGTLKSMITEDMQAIEPKGVNLFMVKNHIRLIIASNNDWVVPAGLEERRFCVFDVSDKYMQDTTYFGKIFDQMDHGGREAMLYDLLRHDFSNIDLRTIPRTEALADQILRGADTITKYWFESLYSGMLPTGGWGEIPIGDLYDSYKEFAQQIGDKYPATDSIFSKKLRTLIPPETKQGRSRASGRVNTWYFPDLEKCRQFLSERMGFSYEWPEPGDRYEF